MKSILKTFRHPLKHSRLFNEKFFRFFSIIAFTSTTLSVIIGIVNLRFTIKSTETQVKKFYLQKVNFIINDAIRDVGLSDEALISHLIQTWQISGDIPNDEYMCIADSNSTLILHTKHPKTISNYIGSNRILGSGDIPGCSFAELVNSQKEYIGDYISSEGESQLAAFVPIPEKKWVLGLHRSKEALRKEILSRAYIPIISFLLVAGIFLPISLFIMYRFSRNAYKKQKAEHDQFLLSEERFRKLYEESPIAMVLYDKYWKLIDVNYSCEKLFGNTGIEQIRQLRLFKEPNIPVEIRKKLKDSGSVNTQIEFDSSKIKNRRSHDASKNGILHLNVYITELKSVSEVLDVGYLVQIENITDRRNNEIALRANENLLRKITENYPRSYVAVIEKDFTVSLMSGQEFKDNPIKSEDYLGKSVTEILGDFSYDGLEKFTKVFSGEKIAFEKIIMDRYYQFYAIPLVNDEGEIPRILAVAENITEEKRRLRQITILNRLYSVLSKVNQAIVRIHDSRKLFDKVCRITIDDGGFVMAWIGQLDSETDTINIIASAGETGDYIDNLKIILDSSKKFMSPTGKAVKDGRAVICNDIKLDPVMTPWRERALHLGYRSSAAFPLFVKNEMKGSFTLYAETPGFFDTAEVNLLKDLANNISFAMEYIENEEERLRSESLFKARVEINKYALDHNLSDLLTRVVDIAEKMTKSQIGFLHIVEDDQKTLHSQVWSTNTVENYCSLKPNNHSYSIDEAGIWTESLIRSQPVIHNDYESITYRKGLPENHPVVMRQMIVPAIREGNVKLLLGVGNKYDNYLPEEASQISKLADFTWDIWERKNNENTRIAMNREVQIRYKEIKALYKSSQKLQGLKAPDELAQDIIDILENEVGYDHCAVLLIDPSSKWLIPYAVGSMGHDKEYIEKDKKYILSKITKPWMGISGYVAKTGESVRTGDVRKDSRYFAMRSKIRSELCVALKVREKITGVINIESEKPNIYTARDQILLETISAHIAVAIENSQAHEEIRKKTAELESQIKKRIHTEGKLLFSMKRMELLREIDKTIIRSGSIKNTTAGVLHHLHQLIPCQSSAVLLPIPDMPESLRIFTLNTENPSENPQYKDKKFADQWWKSPEERQLTVIQNFNSQNVRLNPLTKQLKMDGFRSFVNAPFVIQNTYLGALLLAAEPPNFFTEEYMELILEVCDHVTIALHHINLKREIENAAKELEKRVIVRTKQLQESNKELMNFTHSVSHDLRSPLRSMEGFSDILLEEYGNKLGETGRDYITRISKSAVKMDVLITDLLNYSRIGLEDVELVNVPLSNVFNETVMFLQKDITDSGAMVEIPNNLPKVTGTKSQLIQIMTNLISNSIKYSKPGIIPRIKIKITETETTVNITVSDNGIGIKPEYFNKIFNIFERLHTDDEIPGTGIGLAIVKKTVEKLNGEISVSSVLNRGTEFNIALKKGE